MNKSIIVVNQFAGTPLSGWGERHYYLAEEWVKQGYKVTIVSTGSNHMFVQKKAISGRYLEEYYNHVRFIWIKIPDYNPKTYSRFIAMFYFVKQLLFIPKRIMDPGSTLILSSMPIFPTLIIKRLKRKWKCSKLVFEVRDMWPETPIHLLGYSKNHPFIVFIRILERRVLRDADKIVALLPESKKYMEKVAHKKLQWHYIPNGIKLTKSDPITLIDDILVKIRKSKFTVGYIGTVGYANALDILVESAKLLKEENIVFLIVGDGYLKENYEVELKDCPNVIFHPKIRKSQVQSILEYVDLCFISWHHSKLYEYGVSANKYFDYMLSGKPTLVVSQGMKDPIKFSGAGEILVTNSPEKVSEAILDFSKMDKSKLNLMGKKGKSYVFENHSYTKLAHDYMRLF